MMRRVLTRTPLEPLTEYLNWLSTCRSALPRVQDGAKAACMALAYGTAKDRKKALKCMKVGAGRRAVEHPPLPHVPAMLWRPHHHALAHSFFPAITGD